MQKQASRMAHQHFHTTCMAEALCDMWTGKQKTVMMLFESSAAG